MKYINKFLNSAEYQQFLGGGDYVTPNVTYIKGSGIIMKPKYIVKIIKFYVASSFFGEEFIEYTATEGMTWGEWVNSIYNVDGFYFVADSMAGNYLRSPNGTVDYGGFLIHGDEVIIENYYYYLAP